MFDQYMAALRSRLPSLTREAQWAVLLRTLLRTFQELELAGEPVGYALPYLASLATADVPPAEARRLENGMLSYFEDDFSEEALLLLQAFAWSRRSHRTEELVSALSHASDALFGLGPPDPDARPEDLTAQLDDISELAALDLQSVHGALQAAQKSLADFAIKPRVAVAIEE